MPAATPANVRAQLKNGTPAPIYLIIGDDEAEMSRLTAGITSLVEDELRAFNVDRVYASDKPVTPASIAESARMIPMMADRRVVIVLRAERILKPKKRGGAKVEEEDAGDQEVESGLDTSALEDYAKNPEPQTVLVFVAADVDKTRRLYKALQKTATIVGCWGLKPDKESKDLRHAARMAEQMVRQAASEAGQQIEPAAVKLVADRAGADIVQLRGDLERLLLYTAGAPRITRADAEQVVSAETAQDDWAVTNAIADRDAPRALREVALALESGGVSFMILGQLAWFVREKLPMVDPRRVPAAIDALFRTDLELKNSGDARVLLERLVVELCGPKPAKPGARRF